MSTTVSKPVSANRRQFLWDIGARFPMLALVDLLSRDGFFTRHAQAATPKSDPNPLAPSRRTSRQRQNMSSSFS